MSAYCSRDPRAAALRKLRFQVNSRRFGRVVRACIGSNEVTEESWSLRAERPSATPGGRREKDEERKKAPRRF